MAALRPSSVLLAGALLLACTRGVDEGRPSVPTDRTRSVDFDRVRAEIARHTCATWLDEVGQWSLELLGASCTTGAGDPDLAPAIDAAVASARPVIVLGERAYDRFYAQVERRPGLEPAVADALAREALWSDPVSTRAVLLRTTLELAARGLHCGDCPALAPPDRVVLTWSEFFPYLSAYVWPVQASPGGEVELFVCADIHGAAALPAGEAPRRAGFLVAAAFASDADTHRAIVALKAAHNRRTLRSEAALAREVADFLTTPASRTRACSALAEVAWFTGVVVRDCPAAPPLE